MILNDEKFLKIHTEKGKIFECNFYIEFYFSIDKKSCIFAVESPRYVNSIFVKPRTNSVAPKIDKPENWQPYVYDAVQLYYNIAMRSVIRENPNLCYSTRAIIPF